MTFSRHHLEFLVPKLVEGNWEKTSEVLASEKDVDVVQYVLKSFFLTISIQFIVIIDYFLDRIHIESMH